MLTIKNHCVFTIKAYRPLLLPLTALSLFALSACGGNGTGLEGTTSLLGGADQQTSSVAQNLPIAYVRRTLTINADNDPIQANILNPRSFNGGARLFIRNSSTSSAAETDITSSLFDAGALYDVKDLSPSFDGTKLAFAMRAPLIDGVDENDPSQPTWNIWEYNLTTNVLRRIITSNTLANSGHDISPHYLPGDQRIVFSSTRQTGSQNVQADEGIYIANNAIFSALNDLVAERFSEAFVLHTMNADRELIQNNGQEIQQITYNQSHDLQPTVLSNGKIVFLRWDAAERRNKLSLYTVKPDGSEMNFLYGYHSQNTVTNGVRFTLFDLSELPDNRLLTILKHRDSSDVATNNYPILGGDLLAINSENFTETNQPTNGGQRSISPRAIPLDETISTSGYYNSAFPMYDGTGRLLVTWSPCRLNDATKTNILFCTESNLELPGVTEADPLYGIWVFNPSTQTQRPIALPTAAGDMFTDIVAITPRAQPPILTELTDASGYGTLNIRSIYDFSGVVDNTPNGADIATVADPSQAEFSARKARFLRVVKAVNQPNTLIRNFDNAAFGIEFTRGMRQILGYTPIEPDGSVKVQIPSNVAFHIEIVDAQGQRLPEFQLHRNWLQLVSGEQRNCTGCHTSDSELPHGRPDFEAVSVHNGAPYPNTSALLPADEAGETMAEIESRVSNRTRKLVPDLLYTDKWSGAAFTPEANTELRYAENGFVAGDVTRVPLPPTNDDCLSNWQSTCRIIINYEDHIQPLWEADRFAIAGDTTSTNRSCVLCHTTAGNTQVAAGQLELTTTPAGFYFVRSYIELLQEGAQDSLQDSTTRMIPSSSANSRFFDVMNNSASGTVDHSSFMTEDELRLISEWIDIGAQYYNNPFDAPLL